MESITFNIVGSSALKCVLERESSDTLKSCVFNTNPLFLSDGERESLASNKGDWLVMDDTCLMCGVDSIEDIVEEIESLSKFMRKTWNRKIIFVSMRPSTYCAKGESVRPIPNYKPYTKAAEIGSKLQDSVKCYIVTLPFECISKDGKPYHYIPLITQYIKSVIDVITVKYDRNTIDKLAMDCSIDIRNILGTIQVAPAKEKPDFEELRRAYNEAVEEGKTAKACAICADLVSKGDMWAAPNASKSFWDANKVCKDNNEKIKWLRKFSNSGMDWPNPILFDLLWNIKSPETDAEMIEAIRGMAERGNGNALKRLARAYREGRGVERNLDKSLEYAQKAYDAGTEGANLSLFETLWKIGTPEAYAKMIPLVEGPASKGDIQSMVRLAHAYRDGKGVEKNIEKSITLLEKVVAERPAFSKELENTRKLLK